MLKHVKNITNDGYYAIVFEGTDTEWAELQGFVQVDVVQGYDGQWYPIDKAPSKPQSEIDAERITVIDTELATLDAKSARSLRAIASGKGTEQDTLTITTIEERAEVLRAERATLAPPATFSL